MEHYDVKVEGEKTEQLRSYSSQMLALATSKLFWMGWGLSEAATALVGTKLLLHSTFTSMLIILMWQVTTVELATRIIRMGRYNRNKNESCDD